MQQYATPPGHHSPLLHCLKQLNDDAWSRFLLPKLLDHGSAANVALTCQQLRHWIQSNRTQLNLMPLADHPNPDIIEGWTASLPEGFPRCSSVKLALGSTPDCGLNFTAMMPALARLPHLSLVTLEVSRGVHALAVVCLMLDNIRRQLPKLQTLSVMAHDSWASSSSVWEVLGRATQLQTLWVDLRKTPAPAYNAGHLTALSSLTNLEAMRLTANTSAGEQDLRFLSCLTKLTSLILPARDLQGLDSINGCSSLRSLMLIALMRRQQLVLRDDVARLQQLQQLECISIPWPALKWQPAALPALCQLQQLQTIEGAWDAAEDDNSCCCASVQRVIGQGHVPFAAFPALVVFGQQRPMLPGVLSGIASCKLLKAWLVDARRELWFKSFSTLTAGAADADVLACINSLRQLKQLQVLEWYANCDLELQALASAVTQSCNVLIGVPPFSKVTVLGLVQLSGMPNVKCLTLVLHGLTLSQQVAELLIGGLHPVPQLVLFVENAERANMFRAAKEQLIASGLNMPAQTAIRLMDRSTAFLSGGPFSNLLHRSFGCNSLHSESVK